MRSYLYQLLDRPWPSSSRPVCRAVQRPHVRSPRNCGRFMQPMPMTKSQNRVAPLAVSRARLLSLSAPSRASRRELLRRCFLAEEAEAEADDELMMRGLR